MKRILLSTVAVIMLVALTSLFARLQECQATTKPEPASTSPNMPMEIVDAPQQERVVAQAEPESVGFYSDSFEAAEPAPPAKRTTGRAAKRTIKVPVTRTVYEDVAIEMGDVTPLQQRYSVLMLKRAQRMTEDELKEAIAKVKAELNEQDEAANTELQTAIEILEKLQQNAGGTPAASRAGEALPILHGNQPAPVYDDATDKPVPSW